MHWYNWLIGCKKNKLLTYSCFVEKQEDWDFLQLQVALLYNSETSGIPLHMQVLKQREIKRKRQTKQKQISSAISLFLGDYTPFMFEHCLGECICGKKITVGQFCSVTTPAPLFLNLFLFFLSWSCRYWFKLIAFTLH